LHISLGSLKSINEINLDLQTGTRLRYNVKMKRERILLILGLWVAVLPYLGFPSAWKDVLFTLSGFGLVYISYVIYKESKREEVVEEKTFENFSENRDFKE